MTEFPMWTASGSWQSALMDNYGTPGLTLVRGDGATCGTPTASATSTCSGGIAVNALGHAHPAVVAGGDRAGRHARPHLQLLHQPARRRTGRASCSTLVGARHGKVLFCNSGAEANEAAFKMARLTGRTKVIACDGAFHGRTMGALALTGQPAKRTPFEPLPAGVVHVPYGDIDALRPLWTSDTAAVFLEPIHGRGRRHPRARRLPARPPGRSPPRHGALLVLDEVQTGIGRTGSWFALPAGRHRRRT